MDYICVGDGVALSVINHLKWQALELLRLHLGDENDELAVHPKLDVIPVLLREIRDFDLVLSYTGGGALRELSDKLGARRTAALFGHVDCDAYRKIEPVDRYRADLSYLGTYAADRQAGFVLGLAQPGDKD